jgi:hypothetical protein
VAPKSVAFLAQLRIDLAAGCSRRAAEIVAPNGAKLNRLVEDVRQEVKLLSDRVAHVEQGGGASSFPAGSSAGLSKEAQSMIDSLDPANRRVSFIGVPSSMSAKQRIATVDEFMSGAHPDSEYMSTENILKGPRNDRAFTSVAYIEFASVDGARAFLRNYPKDSAKAKLSDSVQVLVKPARSKLHGARDFP